MNAIKKIFAVCFKVFELLAVACMIVMVVVVFIEVIKRYFFATGYRWSQEISTLMMVWFGFAGIAIDVLEKRHMSIELFTMKLPPNALSILERFNYLIITVFGICMVYYGIIIMNFTKLSTLPATKWPSSTLYFILPLTGVFIALNGLILFFGKDTDFLDTIKPSYTTEDL